MTERRDTAPDPDPDPDPETAKRAAKASVRNAIGKLIGDDDAGTPPGPGAGRKKNPPRR